MLEFWGKNRKVLDTVSHFAQLFSCFLQTPEENRAGIFIHFLQYASRSLRMPLGMHNHCTTTPPLMICIIRVISEAPIKNFPWFSNIVVFRKHHTAYSHFPHPSDLFCLWQDNDRELCFLHSTEFSIKPVYLWDTLLKNDKQQNGYSLRATIALFFAHHMCSCSISGRDCVLIMGRRISGSVRMDKLLSLSHCSIFICDR